MLSHLRQRLATIPAGLRQTATYALTPVIAKAVSFLMVPVFTGYLEPADYGRLDILQTLADLLSIVIGLGLADTLFRFAGSEGDPEKRRRAAANLFGISLLSGGVFLVATQLAAPMIAGLLPGDIPLIQVRIILASLAFSALILVPLSWLRLQDRVGGYVAGTAGRAVAQAGLAALLLVMGFGVTGVLAAGLIACLALAAWLFTGQIRATGLRFERAVWANHLRFGGPLVAAGMAAFVMSSCDRWFVAAYAGAADLAPYAVAAKFALMVAMLFQPFDMWWVAKRYDILRAEGGAARLARSAELGSLVLAGAVIAVAGAGPLIVAILTPAAYHGAAGYLPWLALVVALRSCGTLFNLGLLSGRSTLRALTIESGCALLAIGLFAALIPRLGPWGAIAATGAALAARLLVTLIVAQRMRPLPHRLRGHLLALALAAIAAAAAALAPTPWHAAAAGGLLLVVLAAGALALGIVAPPRRGGVLPILQLR